MLLLSITTLVMVLQVFFSGLMFLHTWTLFEACFPGTNAQHGPLPGITAFIVTLQCPRTVHMGPEQHTPPIKYNPVTSFMFNVAISV